MSTNLTINREEEEEKKQRTHKIQAERFVSNEKGKTQQMQCHDEKVEENERV